MIFYKIYQEFLLFSLLPWYWIIVFQFAITCDMPIPQNGVWEFSYYSIFINTALVLWLRKRISKGIALFYLAFTPIIMPLTVTTKLSLFGVYFTDTSGTAEWCCKNFELAMARHFGLAPELFLAFLFSTAVLIIYLILLAWDAYKLKYRQEEDDF